MTVPSGCPFDLSRFREAQDNPQPGLGAYPSALSELREGRKVGHWMWYIFPQARGLGHSDMAVLYAIGSLQEAAAFLADPVLGGRLTESARAMLAHAGELTAIDVLGPIDAAKLHASMTLFARVTGPGSPFRDALFAFFGGMEHPESAAILDAWSGGA
jgi:uncharacterized protein (DUF1810 family)